MGYAVWAHHRFALSLGDVEDLLAARFGVQFAAKVRLDRPRPTDKWHLDEVVVPIKGRKHWLWRAIDANGDILDILVQSRPKRHRLPARSYRHARADTFEISGEYAQELTA